MNMFAACQQAVCLISVMLGSRLQICWFLVGWLLFHAVAVCHLKRHCQVFPSQSLWLDFQILISSTAFTHCLIHTLTHTHTHTHTLLNLDFDVTHSFHSLHRCLLLAFHPQAFGRGWAHSCFLLWRIVLNLPTSFTIFPLLQPSPPVFLHVYLSPSSPHVSLTFPEHCSIHYIIPSLRCWGQWFARLWSCSEEHFWFTFR